MSIPRVRGSVVFGTDFGGFGGGERVVLERALALSARGWSVSLVAPPGALCNTALAHGVVVHECPRTDKKALRSSLGDCRPDICHLFSYGSMTRMLAGAAYRRNIPIVLTVSALGFPTGLRSRLFVRRAAAITAASDTVLRDLRHSRVRMQRAEVLPDFPLEWAEHRPSRRPFEDRDADAMVVGWVGRFDPVKRLEDVILAFAGLVDAVPQAVLKVAAGSDSFGPVTASSYRDRMRAISESLGVGERIAFLEDVTDVYVFLNNVDVFVLSSERETFSRATFEAMLMGRAIVATRAAAVAEMIRDERNGILVNVGDVAAITSNLAAFSADRDRAVQLGIAARATAMNLGASYDPINKLETIYGELKSLREAEEE